MPRIRVLLKIQGPPYLDRIRTDVTEDVNDGRQCKSFPQVVRPSSRSRSDGIFTVTQGYILVESKVNF